MMIPHISPTTFQNGPDCTNINKFMIPGNSLRITAPRENSSAIAAIARK